jgi:Hemerythrin HHE cation binding domain
VTRQPDSLAGSLETEHRRLDELLGRFLAAAAARDADAAREEIQQFDDFLRRHTAWEEERLYPPPAGAKLSPVEEESAAARQSRELRLEHVQIREVSGMMRRLLFEKNDLAAARALAGNLARRWDAHTSREERDVFPALKPKEG